jgi:hypothetical protein
LFRAPPSAAKLGQWLELKAGLAEAVIVARVYRAMHGYPPSFTAVE